jgi:CHAT domain-containing protein/Tfp pilus assembly protein PilF
MARTCFPLEFRRFALALAILLVGASGYPPQGTTLRQAKALCQGSDWLGAEKVLREALQRFGGEETDDVWQMRLLYWDALIGLGKYDMAAAVLAPQPPPRLAHSAIAIRRLTDQAVLAYRTSAPDAVQNAQTFMNDAESLARRYHKKELARVLAVRAGIESARHEDAAAERHAHEAILRSRESNDRRMEMNALGALAHTRTFQGRYDEAIESNRRALALANQIGSTSKIQKMSGNLAWTYILLGDFDTATDYLAKAIPIAKQNSEYFDLCSWLDNLGKIAMYRRDYRTAIAYFRQSTAVARRVNRGSLGEFIVNSAEALLELGDLDSARKANDEAQRLIDAKNDPLQLRSLLIDARIDAKSGQIDSAITKVLRVVGAANAALRWEAEARLAQFLIVAKRRTEANEQFRRAIETAAEFRGKIKEDELRLPFGALVREINEQYVDFLLDDGHVDEAFAVVERSRAQTLDDALDTGAEPRRIDPKQIAADRDAVILSYWLTPERSYVWTITASSIEVTPLPAAAAMESALDAYSQEMLNLRTATTSMPHGAALYTMLVQPVAKRIPAGKRVIIVPDGRLHAFNMETLVVPSTRRYWIQDVTIEMAGSLQLLAGSRTARAPRSLLLVGDPPPAGEFLRLSNAGKEMDLVSRHFPEACTTLKGARATPRSYLEADAGRYGYIHFVAHAIAPRLQPLDSAVILATDADSYKLYARDILKHTLRAQLVTISSCQSAGTRTYTGEGLVGLAWAFLHAGARQVIAALWEVTDDATPQLMDDLYDGIRRGEDPAAALRNAKLRLIRSHGVYQYPKFWAPFVIYSGS